MSLYEIKPWFRQQLKGITALLRVNNVTPNQITLAAVILSIIFGLALNWSHTLFLVFPLFVLFRMALNAIDGLMASNYGMKTKIGAYLNEGGDIVSDFFLFLPFIPFVSLWLFIPFLILSVLTEIMGILGLTFTGKRHYEGPMGKSDRVFVFSILSLFIYFNHSIPYVNVIFIGINLLLIKTIVNRWRANYV